MKPPFIIIGMHRSGTSLVAKVLEKNGIFMGVLKDHNFEAMHFLSLNQLALQTVGGDWIEPQLVKLKDYQTPSAQALHQEHFKLNTKLQRLKASLFPKAWGFKDPRNTFTLPLWLNLFPEAKIIYVQRNTDDIAQSLKKRNKKTGEVHDPRLNTIEFNRALAETYARQAKEWQAKLGNKCVTVVYEKLIALDKQEVTKLEDFTGRNLFETLKYYRK